MTYTLVWTLNAVHGLARIRRSDPMAAKDVRSMVSALAEDPYPSSSTELGSTALRRLRVGPARVIYEVNENLVSIQVLTIGHTPKRSEP